MIPLMRHLWFQPVIATPGLGPRLLGRGDQQLVRFLLRGVRAGPDTFTENDVDQFLLPLRDPAHARAGSALYRHLILPAIGQILGGTYRDAYLATPTRVLYGRSDPGAVPEMYGGFEDHARDLTVEGVDRAGHFIADDRPDEVARHAAALFASV